MAVDPSKYKELTQRTIKKKGYDGDELNAIRRLIERYFREHHGFTLAKNPANFISLADAINEKVFNKKDVVSQYYLHNFYFDIRQPQKQNVKKIDGIKKYFEDLFKTNITVEPLPDWVGTINESSPQWADFNEIDLKGGQLNAIHCTLFSRSPYFRFGYKLMVSDGKLFGDATIQSQTKPELLLHITKNFDSAQLSIAPYKNGVRLIRDKSIDVVLNESPIMCGLEIDGNNFLHFYINRKEVYTILIAEEIRTRLCAYVWGDSHQPDPEVIITNFKVTIKHG